MGSTHVGINWALGIVTGALALNGCLSKSEPEALVEQNQQQAPVEQNQQQAQGEAGSGMGQEQSTASVQEVDASDRTIIPSAACGNNAISEQGVKTLTLSDGKTGEYIVTVPNSNDGTTPLPLMFAFHGARLRPSDCIASNCGGLRRAVEQDAITIYMGSIGETWTDTSLDSNVMFFDELLQFAKDNYCIDERRVVALGTSSGAHFSNILGCRRGNDLMAIVPGAGEAFERDDNATCEGRVAALVIHGVADSSVPFSGGEAARDYYAARNGCSTTTTPELAPLHTQVSNAFDAEESQTQCADFDGCDDGLSVRWCEHSEPGYDGSTHGWPSTGGPEAVEFMKTLY